MAPPTDKSKVAMNVATARIIPALLALTVAYATYVLVALLCVNYLLLKHNDRAAAVPILVIYFVLLLLMGSSFFRLLYITTFDPPYVPLGPGAIRQRNENKEKRIPGREYDPENSSGDTSRTNPSPNDDPDSPGLELFYTKDVFVCEQDGRPRWCSSCCNWKPDRAHHCSTSNRCILKMDHFCPWVGGPIGENNFKFFIQFTGYTALYCTHILVAMAIYTAKQMNSATERVNAHFAVILGLAAFFGLFTAGMTGTSIHLAINNLTQVENRDVKTRRHVLAVLEPSHQLRIQINPYLASQSPWHRITYPLGADEQSVSARQPSLTTVPQQNAIPQLQDSRELVSNESESGPTSLPESPSAPLPKSQIDDLPQMRNPREKLSNRDRRATRTFAVLYMPNPGEHPWDLRNSRLNWETVMGAGLLDWLLPLTRSPCCNHEDSESHYKIGPWVDLLRSSAGFIAPRDVSGHDRLDLMPKQKNEK